MKKYIALASSIILLTPLSSTLASNSNQKIGINIGVGYSYSFIDESTFDDNPLRTQTWNNNGGKLFVGYQKELKQQFFLGGELEVDRTGEYTKESISGDTKTYDTYGYYALNLVSSYFIQPNISITGKIGIQKQFSADQLASNDDDKKWDPSADLLLGLKANYYFNKKVSAYLSFDHLAGENIEDMDDFTTALKTNTIGLGVQWGF